MFLAQLSGFCGMLNRAECHSCVGRTKNETGATMRARIRSTPDAPPTAPLGPVCYGLWLGCGVFRCDSGLGWPHDGFRFLLRRLGFWCFLLGYGCDSRVVLLN